MRRVMVRRGGLAVGGHRGLLAVSALVLLATLLLVLVSLAVTGCGSAGKAAPDFSGTTTDGVDVSLAAYRDKPLVLAFMASW